MDDQFLAWIKSVVIVISTRAHITPYVYTDHSQESEPVVGSRQGALVAGVWLKCKEYIPCIRNPLLAFIIHISSLPNFYFIYYKGAVLRFIVIIRLLNVHF